MMQHKPQLGGGSHIATPTCILAVVDDHAPDQLFALWRLAEPRAHLQGGDLGQMLMLADRGDFVPCKSAQPQAILVAQHRNLPRGLAFLGAAACDSIDLAQSGRTADRSRPVYGSLNDGCGLGSQGAELLFLGAKEFRACWPVAWIAAIALVQMARSRG